MGVKAVRLNKEPTEYCVGTVYEAAWTAASSSAYGTALTDALTLPAGTYVLVGHGPVASRAYAAHFSAVGNTYFDGQNYMLMTAIARFTAQTSVQISASGSEGVTFSYLERGRLRAVRIA